MRTGGSRHGRATDVSHVPVFPLPAPVSVSFSERLEIIDFAGGSRSNEAVHGFASGPRGLGLIAGQPKAESAVRPESLGEYGRCVNTSREKSDA